MKSLRSFIRNIISEISVPDEYYAQTDVFQQSQQNSPGMIETEKLAAFLDSEGIFGMESDLVSILEKNPTNKVASDLESFMKFKNIDKQVEHLTVDEMLDLYLSLNHMPQHRDQIRSYAT
jgi:hypothetical protein